MALFLVMIAILFLVFLLVRLKLNAMLAILTVAIGLGLALGDKPLNVVTSVQNGAGSILSVLSFILVLGAMIGRLLTLTGAAQQIAAAVATYFGPRQLRWAVLLTGVVIGTALFFDTAIILIIPVIFSVATVAGASRFSLGLTTATALIIMHAMLPPHPGPIAVMAMVHANSAQVIGYGALVIVPTLIGVAYWLPRLLKAPVVTAAASDRTAPPANPPTLGASLVITLLPIVLIAAAALVSVIPCPASIQTAVAFVGDPLVALIISLFIGTYVLGMRRGIALNTLMDAYNDGIRDISTIIMINAAGGALKQVILDNHVNTQLTQLMTHYIASPLIIAFITTACLRVLLGSATLAAITTGAIVAPLAAGMSPTLLTLAIGAGSIFCSHVNDPGFWIFKTYFRLSIKETLQTWTVITTVASLSLFGLIYLIACF